MHRKTFLLGVGCQKGGTTWLHKHLSGHPQCDMGIFKEYHALNVHYLPDDPFSRHLYRDALRKVAVATRRLEADFPTRGADLHATFSMYSRRIQFFTDLKSYADYFAALSLREGIRLVGDITPAYAILDAQHFSTVRQLLEKRGLRVKVVFLMRDPVDRIYSYMRMLVKNGTVARSDFSLSAEELFERDFAKEEASLRTRYDRTIGELEKAFEREDIFLDFYETIFNKDRICQLSQFLGIDPTEPRLSEIVNESLVAGELPSQVAIQARAFYDDVYEYCVKRFGAGKINKIWKYTGRAS